MKLPRTFAGVFFRRRLRLDLWALLGCVAGLSAGCAGYQLGAASLYRLDISTIHIPIFQSDDLRRGLGERLTEAVVKEVQRRTPYRIVATPDADSILSGRIVAFRKSVLAENINDHPRNLEIDLIVEVTWIDRRQELLMQNVALPLSPTLANQGIGQSASFIPEGGQSMATAQQRAIVRLARQIVDQMELTF